MFLIVYAEMNSNRKKNVMQFIVQNHTNKNMKCVLYVYKYDTYLYTYGAYQHVIMYIMYYKIIMY